MVNLTRIYTKLGDGGETHLGDMSRVPKTHPRIEAYGTVDELNSQLGVVLTLSELPDQYRPWLERVQNDLFDVGADLCWPATADEQPGQRLRVQESQAARVESTIDRLNAGLAPLESFVLPGGTPAAAALHQARATCRRAERVMVALAAIEGEEVGEPALAYINRLSDYLFVAARAANDFGMSDVLWSPGANQRESQDQTEDDE